MSERQQQDEITDAGTVELEEEKLDAAVGGKANVHDIPITRPIDKSSPNL